jgi:hypothetical protein
MIRETNKGFRKHMTQSMSKFLGIRFGNRVSVCRKMDSGLTPDPFSTLGIIPIMGIRSAGMLTVMVEEIKADV